MALLKLADFGPDSGGRVKGVTEVKPIVYGNVSRAFGKKREEDGHTHQWTVYVRPYLNEDMQTYVKKIHFKLHESYESPNRIVTKPPYEVSETGWGEFEVVIKIYFHDPTIYKPVTFYHILKLFQPPSPDAPAITNPEENAVQPPPVIDTKKRLVSEFYDEIVFHEPSQMMQQMLNTIQNVTSGSWTHDTDFEEKKVKSLEHILETRKKVKAEIAQLKEKLQLTRDKIAEYKQLNAGQNTQQ
ncbi:CLUMA_CG013178, isoform A [Clunio marinus]|uniref:CLUMA_CG013178, isoform A n=1 Tax=Clunio marinus TaxID=568069 RepID=A0A1J1II41_9DIPT|nr:CLUMA_CG013178, isoform A [Clunio marinus]